MNGRHSANATFAGRISTISPGRRRARRVHQRAPGDLGGALAGARDGDRGQHGRGRPAVHRMARPVPTRYT